MQNQPRGPRKRTLNRVSEWEQKSALNWSRLVESLAGIYDRLLRKAVSNEAIRAAAK